MVYARIEAYPTKGSLVGECYGGAMVNCWIQRADLDDAVSVARRMIAEQGWFSEAVEEVRYCTRDEFPEESRQYFDQAVTDDEVLVFYTHPNGQK
jgi:hypothetical protein